MEYLRFFGLKEDPFKLTPDPAYFFPSSGHNEGLMLMDYAVDQKEGFLLVTGDPGTGKTTLLRVFLEKWKDRAEIAIVLTPRLAPGEFLAAVAEDFSIALEGKNKNEIIRALRDFMTRKSGEGKRVIIIVDEAQNLPLDTLEELRLLSNLETDRDKLIQIMLIGQPELEAKLSSVKLRQLNQRITTRVHLRHFTAEETREYINYRAIKAERKNLQVHHKTGRLAHTITRGVPRLINMLMSRALMAAYLEEKTVISSDHIRHAVKSLGHGEIQFGKRSDLVPAAAGLAALAVLTVSVYLYLPDKQSETSERKNHQTVISASVRLSEPGTAAGDARGDEEFDTGGMDGPERDAVVAASKGARPSVPTEPNKGDDATDAHASGEAAFQQAPVDAEEGAGPVDSGREQAVDSDLPESGAVSVNEQELDDDFTFISITADVAFIRHWPSIDAAKAGWATKGSHLLVLGESVDERSVRWYQVAYEGEKKWISGEVVEAVDWSDSPR